MENTPWYGSESEEARNLRRLKKIVDRTAKSLTDDPLSEEEAREIIENTRRNVLVLFPGKEDEFELIYRPRFERLLELNAGVHCDRALRANRSDRKGEADAES
jgi:hypothetical protein